MYSAFVYIISQLLISWQVDSDQGSAKWDPKKEQLVVASKIAMNRRKPNSHVSPPTSLAS